VPRRSSRMLQPTHPARRADWARGRRLSTTSNVRNEGCTATKFWICHVLSRCSKTKVGVVPLRIRSV